MDVHFTDEALADEFAREHKGRFAFVVDERRWYRLAEPEKAEWVEDAGEVAITTAVRAFLRELTQKQAALIASTYNANSFTLGDAVHRLFVRLFSASTIFAIRDLVRYDARLAFETVEALPASVSLETTPRPEIASGTPKKNIYGAPLGSTTPERVDIYRGSGVNIYGQPTT
ncbi:MAG: hypothetical protein IRZ28_13200 [Steroidobacteraceae bacterium]|nr:hypothetical protein [Steroidobacteraceae bacterium]